MKRRGGIMLVALAATRGRSACIDRGRRFDGLASKTQAMNCKSTLKIAFVAPFTGGAGFLGNEQLSWAKYAVKTLAPKYGLKIKLVTGDTPVEQGAAAAQTLAQKFVADKAVVAVIGPSTSGAVAASSKTLFQAAVWRTSRASATRTSLTKGADRRRRLRRSSASSRATTSRARRMRTSWSSKGAKKVVLFDFQEPYSQGLADAAELVLKAKGVSTLAAVGRQHGDGLLVVRDEGPERRRLRVLPHAEAGRRAELRAAAARAGQEGEGVRRRRLERRLGKFKVPGSYVSNFAPDISGIRRTTRRSSPVGRRTTPRHSWARSVLRPTSRRRLRSTRSRRRATRARVRSRTGATSSATSRRSSSRTRSSVVTSASRRSRTIR